MSLRGIATAALLGALTILNVGAAELRVVVLDGKSGKPIEGRTIEISSGEPSSSSPPVLVKGVTDRMGVFLTDAKLPERIAVHVKGRYLCTGRNYGTSIQRLDTIMSSGVAEQNLCSPKVSHPPTAGELILFVRRESAAEFFDLN